MIAAAVFSIARSGRRLMRMIHSAERSERREDDHGHEDLDQEQTVERAVLGAKRAAR